MNIDFENLPGRVILRKPEKVVIIFDKTKIILKPTFEGIAIQVIGQNKDVVKQFFNERINH
jgi:hypothetical protein